MRVLMQRVREAAVSVLNELNGIDPTFEQRYMGPGLVLTVDGPDGRLSASIQDIDGEIMSIPQPLTGVERPATGRPRLTSRDADADHALIMWIRLNEALRSGGIPVYEGRYGAHMQIGMVADGPMHLTLASDRRAQ